MKIKIGFIFFITVSFLILGCASGTPGIKFKELTSNTFTLNRIFYATVIDETNREVREIFETLPIQTAVELIKAKYKVNVDISLFSDKEIDISQVKRYNMGMRNHFIEFETESTQIVSMSFTRLSQNELALEVRLRIIEDGKTVAMSDFSATIPK